MKKQRKINLHQLEVKSFVTQLGREQKHTIKGASDICDITPGCIYNDTNEVEGRGC